MSELKLISPLLDGFTMGNPMSEHNGVRCCPAIKENTEKKYIVKIISIPASQVQMDALLLAGAYKDPADAMDYFRQVGEDVLKEAEMLKKLSKLDGFLPYEGWQMEPITRHCLGYEVYLIGSYKRSLKKYLKKHPVTHLEAVNLGLDLCAALSVCRDSGALYVALKPSNIFVSEKKEYRIGDLGFIAMDALSYAALPEKYQSPYTPPELYDPMSALNLTVDTYAVGMILYQLYNDGQLPFSGKQAPVEILPTPVNADYELAEIIMKAIHPDPAERWTDPKEMGKALASYMQRNSVNDVPITPHTPLDVKPEDIIAVPKKKKKSKKAVQTEESIESMAEDSATDLSTDIESTEDIVPVETNADGTEELPEILISEDYVPEEPQEILIPEEPEVISLTEESSEEEIGSEAVLDTEEVENTAESYSEEPEAEEMSEDLSRIIEKADDLIAHEMPEDIILSKASEESDPFAFISDELDEIDDADIPEDPIMEEVPETAEQNAPRKRSEEKFADPKYKRRKKRFVSSIIALLAAAAIGAGAFWYYQNIYLQTINSIHIDGDQNQITVTVDSDVNESLLIVNCLDQYGKSTAKKLDNGTATFSDLHPNTMYTVKVEIDGFHKLEGKTSEVFTTDAETTIVSFSSIAGSEDGSVMLSFTVDGEEPNDWTVFYSTDGETEKRKTFTGHSVSITGLTVGKVYTFRLDPGEGISLGGQTSLELMASRLILAEDLTITSQNGIDITVRWKAPGDVVVDSWTVRCYNEIGDDQQVTVNDTEVTFSNIDPTSSYTIEVTASGMTQPARTSITENPIHVSSITIDDRAYDELTVNWEFSGDAPKDGWLVIYSFVGGQKNVVKSNKATAEIPVKIPSAQYGISIQTADGTTVFNNTTVYTCPDAVSFEKHNLTVDTLTVDLLKTPEDQNWYCENISNDAFTTTFAPGEKISVALRSSDSFYLPGAELNVLYVFRDSYGNILPDLLTEENFYWKNIWNGGDVKNGELNLPVAPTTAGEYTLHIYFDGMSIADFSLTITE